MGDTFSWIVTIVGLIGFELAGRKIWWAWYINIANQFAWAAFALITGYHAFLLGTAFYFVVFCKNAYLWTKNRNVKPDVYRQVGIIQQVDWRLYHPTEILATSRGHDPLVRPRKAIYIKE